MKMILSSCDFHEDAPRKAILENLPKPVGECRVLFIPNERATPENLKNDMYFRRLRQKGFKKGSIFVFDHTRPEDFFGVETDVIYVSGGNTFLTLKKLRDAGFDGELARRIRAGTTYIGGSAGAHIVGKSVAHLTRYDECPDDFSDFRALGLYDGIFICHYGPERAAHFRALKEAGENVTALSNEQTVIVTENGVRLT